jgi:hypothetical protein
MVMAVDERVLGAEFDAGLPRLDQRRRRLMLGAEARSLGRGGVCRVAGAAGVCRAAVTAGVEDLGCGLGPEVGREPLAETAAPGSTRWTPRLGWRPAAAR